MPSEQAVLEEFFETHFEFDCVHKNPTGVADFSDGFVFWRLYFDPEEKFLHFSCDTSERISASPILEAGVHYSDMRVEELYGVGNVLIITHADSKEATPFWITRTQEKRFSLAVAVNVQQED